MSAHEFYFKQPFDINEEYPILKSILFFSLFPIELIFVFTYARIYGSLRSQTLRLIIIFAIINLIISNILINLVKDRSFFKETISYYENLDSVNRKKCYSVKNCIIVPFLMALVPWLICFICITIVCIIVPL